jgi:hypothetical protein
MLHTIPWPVAGALAGLVYLAVLHVGQVDGPGGMRVLLTCGRIEHGADGPTFAEPEDGEPPVPADAPVASQQATTSSSSGSGASPAEQADERPDDHPDDHLPPGQVP